MAANIFEILNKYWGYDTFRPLQEDIINAVINQRDALALLPTGGGKSICFQVPALAQEGICIVVSPLIALMSDQVQNLNDRGVSAVAISSVMSYREIDIALDKCVHGKFKFVYVSPERLQSELFVARVVQMNVNLVAVDESHCISQWGYDFRPSYLNIAEVRKLLPEVPVLALTATATPEVVIDIQEKLEFKQQQVFSKSFARPNLTYWVHKEENKLERLNRVIDQIGGSGVVYVRSRKKTETVAKELQQRNKIADAYHAGLSADMRDIRQKAWIKGDVQIIVATNAFGMGIDKPDVRWVIHLDIPDTLEAYFQEAGRAGRDEKPAKAIILYDDADLDEMDRKHQLAFPEKKYIKRVYTALGNYLRLADGSGKGESFPFDIGSFCKRYSFNALECFNALKILEFEGLVSLSEAIHQPSRLRFLLSKEKFYHLELKEPQTAEFLQLMLRSYSGLMDGFTRINEGELAYRYKNSKIYVRQLLQKLHKRKLLDYLPSSNEPFLTFLSEKLAANNFRISPEAYDWRKKRAFEKLEKMKDYVQENCCRSQLLLEYFGQNDAEKCGTCDVCYSENKEQLDFERLCKKVLHKIHKAGGQLTLDQLFDIVEADHAELIKAIEWLKETEKVVSNQDQLRLVVDSTD